MKLEMVLNELSLRVPAPDIPTARRLMGTFIETLSASTAAGVAHVLRTHADFSSLDIAPGYPLAQWRNDPQVDREARLFLKSLTTKAPFLADIDDAGITDRVLTAEVLHAGTRADGLGAALWTEGLAVSLLTEPCWDTSALDLTMRQLDEQGNLTESSDIAKHASRHPHLKDHVVWIAVRLTTAVSSGTELWSGRGELFPNLTFCDNVQQRLESVLAGDPLLRATIKRLFELQKYTAGWHSGAFDPAALPSRASPESEATLHAYGRERTFRCPDGVERQFSWHVRLTPGAWRIHFIPAQGSTIIGYIGPHLPTMSDPT